MKYMKYQPKPEPNPEAVGKIDYTKCWVWRFDDDVATDERKLITVVQRALLNWQSIPVEMIISYSDPESKSRQKKKIVCLLGELSQKLPEDITMWKGVEGRASALIHRVLDALAHSRSRELRMRGNHLSDLQGLGALAPAPTPTPTPTAHTITPATPDTDTNTNTKIPSSSSSSSMSADIVKGLRLELDIPKMKAIQKALDEKGRS